VRKRYGFCEAVNEATSGWQALPVRVGSTPTFTVFVIYRHYIHRPKITIAWYNERNGIRTGHAKIFSWVSSFFRNIAGTFLSLFRRAGLGAAGQSDQILDRKAHRAPSQIAPALFVSNKFSFGVSLIVAEGFGLAAAPVAILIDPVVGALFYLLKVVFAAFAFWFFAQSKEKLLRFGWFAYLYTRTIEVYEWIKSTQLYKRVKSRLQAIRESIKEYIRKLPKGRISSLYRDLKKIFKREL